MKKTKLLPPNIWLGVFGVTLFFVLIVPFQGCETKAEYVGNWSGKTEQGIPIILQIERVDGKIIVTQVEYNLEIETQYGIATKSKAKPEAISVEVIDGEFRYETPSLDVEFAGKSAGRFGFMAEVAITGKFTSNSLLKGSIQTLHYEVMAGTVANDTTYTAKKM
jgi:hypothetical protein